MSAVNKVIHGKKCLVTEHITLANRKFEKMFSEKKKLKEHNYKMFMNFSQLVYNFKKKTVEKRNHER